MERLPAGVPQPICMSGAVRWMRRLENLEDGPRTGQGGIDVGKVVAWPMQVLYAVW